MQIGVEITEAEAQAIANKEGVLLQQLTLETIRKYIHDGLKQVSEPDVVMEDTKYFIVDETAKELLNRLMFLQCRLESEDCFYYSGMKMPKMKALAECQQFIRQTKEALQNHNVPDWVIEKAFDYARNYNYDKYNFEAFYRLPVFLPDGMERNSIT